MTLQVKKTGSSFLPWVVEASRGAAACGSSRVRLGDIEFASVDEARQTAAQLLSACQWAQRPAVKGKVS